MYGEPPAITDTSLNHVAGTATATVLGAPGAGRRYRIVGGILSVNRLSTALVNAYLNNGAAGSRLWAAQGLSVAGTPVAQIQIPEPGIVLDENTLLQLELTASAASSNSIVVVYYFTDSV